MTAADLMRGVIVRSVCSCGTLATRPGEKAQTLPAYEPASLDDIEAAAQQWDDDMIDCRLGRHDFSARTNLDASFDDAEGTYTRVRRCPNCWTDQHRVWSQGTGEVLRAFLDYTHTKEGYLLPAGTGRISATGRSVIAREMMARQRPKPVRAVKPRRSSTKKATTSRRKRAA